MSSETLFQLCICFIENTKFNLKVAYLPGVSDLNILLIIEKMMEKKKILPYSTHAEICNSSTLKIELAAKQRERIITQ